MCFKRKGFTKSKNTQSKRYRRDLAEYLNGRGLKCVTERVEGIEEVVGKSGSILVRGDELLVYSSMDVIFRTKIVDLEAWELMSKDGVVITAPDIEHGGNVRSVVAYYSYWRKMDD